MTHALNPIKPITLSDAVLPGRTPHTLADLLARGLDVSPDAVAIVDADCSYSFRELSDRANAIAATLRAEHRVDSGQRVIVLAAKSPLIVAIALACWRIGAIYVPIDPDNPPRRLQIIIESIEPTLIVSSTEYLLGARAVLKQYAQLSYEACLALDPLARLEVPRSGDPRAAAVIIHTSGSTGTPKGVVLSHASVIAYFHNHNAFLGFETGSVSVNNGPFYFDVSIQDTFLPLFFGASVLFHRGLWVSSVMIALLKRFGVTHLIAVSSVLDLISRDETKLKELRDSRIEVVVTGGEVCPPRLINRWLGTIPGLRVLYGYGPTEVNSLCTTNVIEAPNPGRIATFSIGKPFSDHSAILLDDERAVIDQPDVVGTLALAGPQVMLGYWRDPDLTARVTYQHEGQRFYVTGDRCYRDTNGDLHFEGRSDTEVKIRGRRINLNEIRNALVASADVSYAVVTTAQIEGETRIVAAANINAHDNALESRLRAWVGVNVPEYMQPYAIVAFGQAARTGTDKIDERRMRTRLLELVAANPGQRWIGTDA